MFFLSEIQIQKRNVAMENLTIPFAERSYTITIAHEMKWHRKRALEGIEEKLIN